MKISVRAYAKINLFLDITSLREDKYHNIVSFMQSIDLYDTVTVEYLPSSAKNISVSCSMENVPLGRDNIAYRAAEIFPVDSGIINIHIHKNIPMSAGLAGGSTDAAAVLVGLNYLLDNKLSKDELKKIGRELGADVPFCIEGGACIARGIGEELVSTAPMPKTAIVVARLGDGMSTPLAYRTLDEKYNNFVNYVPKLSMLDILTSADTSTSISQYCDGLHNIFEEVVENMRPDVTRVKSIMVQKGAVRSMMSGSGTSVFGIFENKDDANAALHALRDIGADTHICYPCDNSEQLIPE